MRKEKRLYCDFCQIDLGLIYIFGIPIILRYYQYKFGKICPDCHYDFRYNLEKAKIEFNKIRQK